MSGQVRNFFHSSQTTGTDALSTSFSAVRAHNLTAGLPAFMQSRTSWLGFLESLCAQVTTIAGGATSLIVRVTKDVTGDECVIPDTTATISTGVTTATSGSVVFSSGVGLGNYNPSQTDAIVYVWVKTNAGTAVLTQTTLIWRE